VPLVYAIRNITVHGVAIATITVATELIAPVDHLQQPPSPLILDQLLLIYLLLLIFLLLLHLLTLHHPVIARLILILHHLLLIIITRISLVEQLLNVLLHAAI